MKGKLIGVLRMQGTSKKNGAPYDFTNLLLLVPATSERNDKMVKEAYGFEIAEVRGEPKVLDVCSKLKYPADVLLTVENQLNRFRQMEAVCVGVAADTSHVSLSPPARVAG